MTVWRRGPARRDPAAWLLGGLIVLGSLDLLAGVAGLAIAAPLPAVASSAIVIALHVLPVLLVVFLLRLRRTLPVGAWLVALPSGFAAASLAALAGLGWLVTLDALLGEPRASELIVVTVGPAVEEGQKALMLLLVLLVLGRERWGALEGYLVGGLVGLGFGIAEDIGRGLAALGTQGEGLLVGVISVLLSGIHTHASFSALIGAAVLSQRDGPRLHRLGIVLAAVGLAIVLHALWNSPAVRAPFGEPLPEGDPRLLPWILFRNVPSLAFLSGLALIARAQRRVARRY